MGYPRRDAVRCEDTRSGEVAVTRSGKCESKQLLGLLPEDSVDDPVGDAVERLGL
jgi:hypothetical protein